jgi:putative transcriptional regulator
VRLLRDKAALTRMLLLLELQRGAHTKLQGLADTLGMTVQGVSNYVGEAERAGLVRTARGRYEVTPRGTAALQEHLAELKAFTDLAWQRTSVIQRCAALARTNAREGDPVGLFMEDGLLVARARKASPSRGVAAHAARAGEVLVVGGLEGLVAIKVGRLVVLKLPTVTGPGTRAAGSALRRWLAREGLQRARLGVVGVEAQAVARAARMTPDLEFAAAHAAHHAAQLGVPAVLLVGADEVRFATAALDRLNEDAMAPIRAEMRELKVGR